MPDSPTDDFTALQSRCDELLNQLQYTADEVAALRVVINRVPEELLNFVPADDALSIKGLLGHITVRDKELASVLSPSEKPGSPAGSESADGWEEQPIDTILQDLEEHRNSFVADLRRMAARADVELLQMLAVQMQRIVEQDVDAFREVAVRLHSAGIGAG